MSVFYSDLTRNGETAHINALRKAGEFPAGNPSHQHRRAVGGGKHLPCVLVGAFVKTVGSFTAEGSAFQGARHDLEEMGFVKIAYRGG